MLNYNDYKIVIITYQGECLDKYVKLLKENNMKITPQRLIILEYLDTHMTHPTADKIFKNLKVKNPSLSKTTVYNSLESLKEHGLIQALTICGSEQRYDIDHGMHHHFLCKKCGKIIDIEMKCPNIDKMIKSGHFVDEVHGYFKGTCENCLKKECE
jgi:Fe2+ or Zn2+ uptake regulation protein